LLGLLVITGLAGTLKNNSLNSGERKRASGMMKESSRGCIEAVEGLSRRQADFKPSRTEPSIREIFYHLVISEQKLWAMMENVMQSPSKPEDRALVRISDDELVNLLEAGDPKFDILESPATTMPGFRSTEEALTAFKKQRHPQVRYMKTTTEDLRDHIIRMPFGAIDGYQLYLLIAAHANRHTREIEKLRDHSRFPR